MRYADFLEMADRHVIYKQLAKEIAIQQGLAVTFMAKLDERYAGSSMHLHSSLWSADDGKPAVRRRRGVRRPGETLPERFRWWLGGLMTHARACTLLFAPYVNSYKRFRAGSFAPTGIAWSYDNRTAGFRIVGRGRSLRVECRIPGCRRQPVSRLRRHPGRRAGRPRQPHRAAADVSAATSTRPQSLPTVPTSLPEAIAEFEASPLFREAFGEDVVEHLLHFARTEQRKFDEVVTTWERRRFLERA